VSGVFALAATGRGPGSYPWTGRLPAFKPTAFRRDPEATVTFGLILHIVLVWSGLGASTLALTGVGIFPRVTGHPALALDLAAWPYALYAFFILHEGNSA